MNRIALIIFVSAIFTTAHDAFAQLKTSGTGVIPSQLSFSAIRGTDSRKNIVVATNDSDQPLVWSVNILGDDAKYFSLSPDQSDSGYPLDPEQALEIGMLFSPPADFIGIATATLQLTSAGQTPVELTMHGLSTKGLEGKNEPSLADTLKALGLGTDVGWSTLANHIRPELLGEELEPTLFSKAGVGNVDIIPIARYSPSFRLPFGYYTENRDIHQVGVLSHQKQPIPEHQTLYPKLEEGTTQFDPADQPFGIYTTSPTHDAFSQDVLNRDANKTSKKRHAVHACRTYPARDSDGKLIPDAYLFCFEEAGNGDYQDYVFLVKNIRPVTQTDFNPNPQN